MDTTTKNFFQQLLEGQEKINIKIDTKIDELRIELKNDISLFHDSLSGEIEALARMTSEGFERIETRIFQLEMHRDE